jgi:hypothetical protein
MAKRQVFYSFHYKNDVMRVQLIRNMGMIDGNPPASPNEWETVVRNGESAIKRWIDSAMNYRTCVIVLIGSETASRKWVKYEIEKAWKEGKGLFGIYIHNLKDTKAGVSKKGANPFDQFTIGGKAMSSIVRCYDPNGFDAYNDIRNNIDGWIETAINQRQ